MHPSCVTRNRLHPSLLHQGPWILHQPPSKSASPLYTTTSMYSSIPPLATQIIARPLHTRFQKRSSPFSTQRSNHTARGTPSNALSRLLHAVADLLGPYNPINPALFPKCLHCSLTAKATVVPNSAAYPLEDGYTVLDP